MDPDTTQPTSQAATRPDELPQHTRPSRDKVAELPEKQRTRALSVANHLEEELDNGNTRSAFLRITHVLQESDIRTQGNHTGWGVLQVEKTRQRETMPAHTNKPPRPPPRLAVSAPIIPKGVLSRPVPASPVGNAWSGEHFWQPQFSQSVPGSPTLTEDSAIYSDPIRRALYKSTVAKVEACTRELKVEAALHGERMADVECEVVAAMQVLEEKNAKFARDCEFPVPRDNEERLKEFAEEERQALVLNSVHHYADLKHPETWLQLEPSSLQLTTVLDYARANLRIVKERRKSAELEPSEQVYGLVYAVQVLEEKVKKLKARDEEEESDDETMDYGKFLKSINEEVAAGENRRGLRRGANENSLEERRLKGRAPSALSLEAWATELRDLNESEEIGVAISKDD
ncbi:hypothetical protein N0V90_001564 [Kalmusia sp. IMI 367209]|nr:hypothetical protein N0V90_001564 [Kalmusia sp. IMI 367209]